MACGCTTKKCSCWIRSLVPVVPRLDSYDTIVVYFSGGKDSLACVLRLLDLGVPKSKIELWHHEIDGREGNSLMDWSVTADYCRKVAAALELPIYFSWKQGGFEREMLKDRQRTAANSFEVPTADGVEVWSSGGTTGDLGTRLRFPQTSMDLKVRWCSAALKIDVASMAIRNQDRFLGKRTLVLSGERAQESGSPPKDGKPASGRAGYKQLEPDRTHLPSGNRDVDRWRPVHTMLQEDVWALISKYRVAPHPAYSVGLGRCSCEFCIFMKPDDWATVAMIDEDRFKKIVAYEHRFGTTIRQGQRIEDVAASGTPYDFRPVDANQAVATEFRGPVILNKGKWSMPLGAFADGCGGPT